MSLVDEFLAQPTGKEPQFTPKTEFDGVSGFVQTGARSKPVTEADYSDILTECGYDPAKVRIVGNPRVSRWEVPGYGWMSAYRFHIESVESLPAWDIEELVAVARKASFKSSLKEPAQPGAVRVLQVGDQQLGKVNNGEAGIADVLTRWMHTLAEFGATLHPADIVAVLFVGDACEGCVSQAGKNQGYQTVLTMTEQTRVYRRLLMETVVQLAPLCADLTVAVVGGNHDEATRQVNTKAGDNWAVDSAIAVADALKLAGTYEHVRVLVPPETQGHMTISVGGEVIHVQHGHQLPRPYGVAGMAKWVEKAAFYNTPATGASVYAIGHGHTFQMQVLGGRTFIQSSTSDSGSDWFADRNGGAWQPPFATSYTVAGGRVNGVVQHYEREMP